MSDVTAHEVDGCLTLAGADTEPPIGAPPLPATRSALVARLLDHNVALLDDLARGLGGAYHVVVPDAFSSNVAAFVQELASREVTGDLRYAKKANKAACFAQRAAADGIGVDVASVHELRAALGAGVPAKAVVVTGPAKEAALLRLAVQHGCLVTVDALDELERLLTTAEIARPADSGPPEVILRCRPPAQPQSRFGLNSPEVMEALRRCRGAAGAIRLRGFSFHLSGYDIQARTDLAAELVDLCIDARKLGLPVDLIDIGGGFPVNYVAGSDWEEFHDAFRQEPHQMHAGRRFDAFYPYHSPTAGAQALGAVLDGVPTGHSIRLAELLRRSSVTVLAEPGRALLDQAGFTVFPVLGAKDRRGGNIVTAAGTSFSLSEQWFASEFLPDPVLLRPDGRQTDPGSVDLDGYPACIGGSSCLESDMLSWRYIMLPFRPRPGDLLVYLNTAGYQQDSNESPFHEQPLPPKVVVIEDGGRLRWQLDGIGGSV